MSDEVTTRYCPRCRECDKIRSQGLRDKVKVDAL